MQGLEFLNIFMALASLQLHDALHKISIQDYHQVIQNPGEHQRSSSSSQTPDTRGASATSPSILMPGEAEAPTALP